MSILQSILSLELLVNVRLDLAGLMFIRFAYDEETKRINIARPIGKLKASRLEWFGQNEILVEVNSET